MEQIIHLLAENDVSDAAALEESAKNHVFDKFDFVDNENLGSVSRLEGYLFPDTYDFYNNSSPREVLEKMLDNFDYRCSEEMRAQIDTLNATVTDGSFRGFATRVISRPARMATDRDNNVRIKCSFISST